MNVSRRSLLVSASAVALAGSVAGRAIVPARVVKARPVPLDAVRLKPSIWATAVETNARYLLELEPDALLHNFRKFAGLEPKAPRYSGWEGLGIAGHSLGHYLSALSLMYAQTGDVRMTHRVRYIVAQLAEVQKARGDGYVGGTFVQRDGRELDGKIVFEEVRSGNIRAHSFDLNGGWVPLYTWHKVQSGLIDAVRIGQVEQALPVLVAMSDYLAGVLDAISDEQMQKLLVSEHGALNEAFADTYSLTGNTRYLRLAKRIRHRAVLDPLTQGRDILPGLHANMQVPKLLGLGRLYELTGSPEYAQAARFFHQRVTEHHSYAIGGNSEREFFGEPDALDTRLSDRTCEHCNTYNMLKLTRQLYSWEPHASQFDYYERAHLNHVMAAQRPDTGQFVYFMPMASGAKRTYSTPTNNFWCCVGTGMESHSKHGDSIYWEDGRRLLVNLFIPSTLNWTAGGLKLDLDTAFPFGDAVTLTVRRGSPKRQAIAVRLPSWSRNPVLRLNGRPTVFARWNGYAVLDRPWRAGDRIELSLPMELAAEPMPGNSKMVSFRHGPIVLAADLGETTPAWLGPTPGLHRRGGSDVLQLIDKQQHKFRMAEAAPGPLTLKPYFNQYDRRTAVYFPTYNDDAWQQEWRGYQARLAAHTVLDARTVDVLQPGESDQEAAHDLAFDFSEFWQYAGRGMRQAWWGEGHFVEARMAVKPGTSALRVLYWGEDVNKDFVIMIDGRELVRERRKAQSVKAFVAIEYPLSLPNSAQDKVRVRFESRGSDAPFYELRTVTTGQPSNSV